MRKFINFEGDVLTVRQEHDALDEKGAPVVLAESWTFSDPAQAEKHRVMFDAGMNAADRARLDAIKAKSKP